MIELGVQFAIAMIEQCLPFSIVLSLAGLAVQIFMKAAFKGRIEI